MLHYKIKQLFSAILISPYVVKNIQALKVDIVADQLPANQIDSILTIELHSWSYNLNTTNSKEKEQKPIKYWQVPVKIRGDESLTVFNMRVKDILSQKQKESDSFLIMNLVDNQSNENLAKSMKFLSTPKKAKLQKADISILDIVVSEESVAEVIITLQSNVPTPYVFLEAIGYEGKFSDNAMTLLAGNSVKIHFFERYGQSLDVNHFKKALSIRSLDNETL